MGVFWVPCWEVKTGQNEGGICGWSKGLNRRGGNVGILLECRIFQKNEQFIPEEFPRLQATVN
jgi:hypothetical protein